MTNCISTESPGEQLAEPSPVVKIRVASVAE
jgi:hypothetical protein